MSLLALSACDRTNLNRLNHPNDLYLEFRDSSGNNLIELNQLKIDTMKSYADGSYRLNKDEYSLSLKIEGEEQEPDDIWYKHINYPAPGLSFSCYYYSQKLTKKKAYLYEYMFSCPALFGDDRARLIRVTWKYEATGMSLIDELYFEDTLICKGRDCILSVIVLN